MRPMRRLAALLAVAAIAAMPVAVLAASPASAETGVDVQDVCSATVGDGALRINLLILLDTSGSLRTTDPDNLRSAGTRDALQVVESLSLSYSDHANIEVALDTFDARYSRQEGWYPASEIYSRVGTSIGAIATDAGQYTDYGAALTGAWGRFATRADDCNLLIWFTDGQHATEADEAGEQRELFELCSSPEMHYFAITSGWEQSNSGTTIWRRAGCATCTGRRAPPMHRSVASTNFGATSTTVSKETG